jgi:hypothetical protein
VINLSFSVQFRISKTDALLIGPFIAAAIKLMANGALANILQINSQSVDELACHTSNHVLATYHDVL